MVTPADPTPTPERLAEEAWNLWRGTDLVPPDNTQDRVDYERRKAMFLHGFRAARSQDALIEKQERQVRAADALAGWVEFVLQGERDSTHLRYILAQLEPLVALYLSTRESLWLSDSTPTTSS